MTNSRWEQESMPVAPVLSRSEKLPSNLKLAVEAWPEEEDQEQEDGERSDKACGRYSGSLGRQESSWWLKTQKHAVVGC